MLLLSVWHDMSRDVMLFCASCPYEYILKGGIPYVVYQYRVYSEISKRYVVLTLKSAVFARF
jgi:hypothetical protein